jgi:hypothetical protein
MGRMNGLIEVIDPNPQFRGCKSVCLRGGLSVSYPEEGPWRPFVVDQSDLPIGCLPDRLCQFPVLATVRETDKINHSKLRDIN